MKKILPILTVVLSCVCLVNAEEDAARPKKGEGRMPCPDIQAVHKENRELMREHFKAQTEEAKEFRETLKDMDPEARIKKIISFRKRQHKENVRFHEKRYKALVKVVKDCEHISEEKKQEQLKKMEEHHADVVESHKEMHQEVMAFLQELQASDMTPEEKYKAWRTFRQEQREKMQEWRKDKGPHRGEGPGRGGERRGKGERKGMGEHQRKARTE